MKLSFVIVCMLGACVARADVYYDFEAAATMPVWIGTTQTIQNTSASHQGTNAIALTGTQPDACLQTKLPEGTTNVVFYFYDDYGPNPPLYRYMFFQLLEATNGLPPIAGFSMLDGGFGTTPPMTMNHYYAWSPDQEYSARTMGPIRTVGWHKFTFTLGAGSVAMSVDGTLVFQTDTTRVAHYLQLSWGIAGPWGRMDDLTFSTGTWPLFTSVTIYTNDFENPVGDEWSTDMRCQTPGGARPQTWFLGNPLPYGRGFDDSTASLNLTNLPGHSWVEITFEIYIINSWDGIGPVGPDYFTLGINGGPTLLHTTFANVPQPQSYPGDVGESHPPRTGALGINALGFDTPDTYGDTVYRITRRIPHTASSIQFDFTGDVNEPDGLNETWGIDNVIVEAGDPPPIIVSQPQNQTVAQGDPASFSVTVTDANPLTYQWFNDHMALTDGTNATLNLTNIQPNQIGYYSVLVSNGVAGVLSTNAALNIPGESFSQWQGLVAYYPFNGNANDESGNGNHGTVNGAVLTQDRLGASVAAFRFNGSSSVINFSAPPLSQVDNWTLSAWINPASLNQIGSAVSVGYDDGAYGDGFAFGIAAGNGISGGNLFGLLCGKTFVSTEYAFPATSLWSHIVMLREEGVTKFFVNGEMISTTSLVTPRTPTAFSIGSQTSFRFFNGKVDDVRIFNRALSTSEVSQMYAIESFCSPHRALATATFSSNGVTSATMVNYGCGYENTPSVRIVGGSGSGATAIAIMANGIVTDVVITGAGSGYTVAPKILIESPPFVPTVRINVSRVNVAQHVRVNHSYVLESSLDLVNWTPTGPHFTAESEEIITEFVVNQTGQYFRLREVP